MEASGVQRGELAPTVPDHVDMPAEGNQPRDVSTMSPRVLSFFANPGSRLKERTLEVMEEFHRAPQYMRPRLRDKKVYFVFCIVCGS